MSASKKATSPSVTTAPSPASPELTGGAGFTFEDAVAAVYSVALLGETTAPGLPGRHVTGVSVQRGALGDPLDDLIVDSKGLDDQPMRLSLQVKRGLVISGASSNSDFRDTVLRAHETCTGSRFDSRADRVGVITGEISDASKRRFETLCEWARSETTAEGLCRKLSVQGGDKQADFDVVRGILASVVDEPDRDTATWFLLSHFVLARFDLLHEGSVVEAHTVTSLGLLLSPEDAPRADDVWRRLLALIREAEGRAASFNRTTLIARFNGTVRFKGAVSMHRAVTAASEEAKLALAEIGNTVAGHTIARPRLAQLISEAQRDSRFVQVSGLPGSGKSALLRTFVATALTNGPTLFLKSDRISGATWNHHATGIGITGVGLEDFLVELQAMGASTVFIDGLDRVEVSARAVVSDVITTLLDSPLLGGLRLLVTVRDTGMEYLKTWLPCRLFVEGFRTVEVSPFDDEEATTLAEELPVLNALLFGLDAVRAIVRRPFFANVLARRYANVTTAPTSEVELAKAWWEGGGFGAEAADAHLRRKNLVDLARVGASGRGRRIPALNLDSRALADLTADDIIRPVKIGHTVRFTHDIYFEWAFLHYLVSEGESWLDAIRQVGEPPVLGRVVELLSQSALKEGDDWQATLLTLEKAFDIRSQWMRAWMLGPFGLPDFRVHETTYSAVMLAADSNRVAKLLVWYQAEKTKPHPALLEAGPSSTLDMADRLRAADRFAWPSDADAWNRLCHWLIGHIGKVAVSARPDLLSVFEVWQNLAADFANAVSERIVVLVASWLRDIEVRFHGNDFPRDRGEWDILGSDLASEFESRLRRLLLRAGRAYPALVVDYLSQLCATDRTPKKAVTEVIEYSVILSEVCPAELLEFVLHYKLQDLPQERVRRARERGYGNDWHHQDWQTLSIDDRYSHFPGAPTREPFPSLFAAAPDHARRLVRNLANHAIEAWRQLHEVDWQRRGSPLPLTLVFPWGDQTFWGASKEFLWSRGVWGPHLVRSGLMALEDWAFGQIENGHPVDDLLTKVLEGHSGVGALGVACAIALETQHISDVTLPLMTSQRLWKWDIERSVHEMSGSSNLIGFNPSDRAHHAAVVRLNARECRRRDLRSLASLCILHGGDSADRASQSLANFASDLPFEDASERDDPETVARLQRTAEIWAEVGDRSNYHARPMDDGTGFLVEMQNPKAKGPDIDAVKERRSRIESVLRLTNWAHDSFEKGALSDRLSLAEAVSGARQLDGSTLFDSAYVSLAAIDDPKGGVSGVAAALLRFGGDVSAEDADWAADVCLRAWRTQEATDGLFTRSAVLLYHPVLFACQGLAGLLRDPAHSGLALKALVELTGHPSDTIVSEAFGGLLSVWDRSPAVSWEALRHANALSLFDSPAIGSGDRKQREHERVTNAIACSLDRLNDPNAQEGSLPQPPPAWIKSFDGEPGSRRKRGRGVAVNFRHPAAQFDAEFMARILPKVPLSAVMSDVLRRERFLAWCGDLVAWTVDRLCPAWSRGVDDTFEADGFELYDWRHQLYEFLARVARYMDPAEVASQFVEPTFVCDDETFASLMHRFVGHLTAHIMDEPALPASAFVVLKHIVPRLIALDGWISLARGYVATSQTDLISMVRALFFITPAEAMGATRFANGDWRDVESIFPLIEPLIEAHGRIPSVAAAFLTLCENAVDHYPIDRFVIHLQSVLPSGDTLPAGWRESSIVARLSGAIQLISQKAHPLPPATAQKLLKALDILVDRGDRRAGAIQTSEIFRDVRA